MIKFYIQLLCLYGFFLYGCNLLDSTKVSYYEKYTDILPDDGLNSWLPENFPKESRNIYVKTDVETNVLEVYFTLNNKIENKEQLYLNGIQMEQLKKIDKTIDRGWCMYSEYNIWKEPRQNWYVIGELSAKNRYILVFAHTIAPNLCKK
ncbi:hypothetical protein [Snodgrassella gandavensis]|uniref:hypothetical protein n=1 Tax=Snodgrassella gandavensis TaxID=2946698 RepID=UPI001EF64A11|nr:hypothetical protein [Snodgrassella gandavensis]